MNEAIFAFTPDLPAAGALAARLEIHCRPVHRHRFPDGESLIHVATGCRWPILYCRLDHPNAKLFDLQLAVDSLRGLGAERITLVVPYLPYMRQDRAFHPGEAVSQRVLGGLLDGLFATIVTVTPHLHRTVRLDQIFSRARCASPSPAPLLAAMIDGRPLLVGPDGESAALVAEVAAAAGCDWLAFGKCRRGDRDVSMTIPAGADLAGRTVLLVDDICSSGATLAAAAAAALAAGAAAVEALVVHALYDEAAANMLADAGIARLRSLDSVPHPSNAGSLAPLLASALRGQS